MNDGLAAITVRVFLLDHGRIIARLMLPDDCGAITITIAIAVMIAGFADGHAGSDRSHADTNLIRKAGEATAPITAATSKYFFMSILQRVEGGRMRGALIRSVQVQSRPGNLAVEIRRELP